MLFWTTSEDHVAVPASVRHPENFIIFLIDSRRVIGWAILIIFTLSDFFTTDYHGFSLNDENILSKKSIDKLKTPCISVPFRGCFFHSDYQLPPFPPSAFSYLLNFSTSQPPNIPASAPCTSEPCRVFYWLKLKNSISFQIIGGWYARIHDISPGSRN